MKSQTNASNIRPNSADLIILMGTVLLLCFATYQVLMGWNVRPLRSNLSIPMGTVYPKNKDVRLKTQNSYSWLSLNQNEKLYAGDTLFTGENSKVTLDLGDLGRINVEPLSMVTLSESNGVAEVTLHYGEFKSDLRRKELIIKTKGETQVVQPSSASVQVSQTKKTKSVKLLSGSAQLKKFGETKTLKVSQVVESKPLPKVEPIIEKIEPPVIAAVEPPKPIVVEAEQPKFKELPDQIKIDLNEAQTFDQGYYTIDQARRPVIEWEASDKLKKFNFEISADKDFKNVLYKSTEPRPQITLSKVPPHPIFLRVQSENELGEKSEFTPSATISVKTPVALEVPSQPLMKLKGDKKQPELIIRPLPGVPQYELQTSNSPSFENSKTQTFRGAVATLPDQPDKKIFWRIRAMDKSGEPLSDYSQSADYKIKSVVKVESPPIVEAPREVAAIPPPAPVLPPPTTPLLKSPSVKETFVAFSGSPVAIMFQWSVAENSSGYEVQVSDSSQFSSVIVSTKVNKPRNLYTCVFMGGKYFWRVKALV